MRFPASLLVDFRYAWLGGERGFVAALALRNWWAAWDCALEEKNMKLMKMSPSRAMSL